MLQPLSSASRVLMVGLSSKTVSLIDMSVLTRWTVRPRLLSVPGVANVTVWGQRERQLQDAILRGKKVSDEMIQTSQKEAQLLVKEAEIHADRLVHQAMERAQEVENRIHELRTRRKELQIRLKGTLELFTQILEAELEDERTTSNVQTLARRKSG